MRLFGLVDFQHAVLALGLGLVALALAAVAWCGYGRRPGPGGGEEPAGGDDVPGTDHNGVPPVLVFVYAGVAACALGYAAAAWLGGNPVGY